MNPHLLLLPLLTAVLGALLAPAAVFLFLRPQKVKRTLAPLLPEVLPMAEAQVDDFLRNKLPKAMPVVGMFIGDKTIAQFKAIFMDELQTLLPDFIGRCAGAFAKRLIYKAVAAGFVAGLLLGALQQSILILIGPSGLPK
jgi:hypothetical protein